LIPEPHLEALRHLIERLEKSDRISQARADTMISAHCRQIFANAFGRALDAGKLSVSSGEATDTLPHLQRADAQEFLKSIQDDLREQVKIVDRCVTDWFRVGEYPAPAYPWRITVILRKAKLLDVEREFLTAYCKHFTHTVGASNEKIANRAMKVGALIRQ